MNKRIYYICLSYEAIVPLQETWIKPLDSYGFILFFIISLYKLHSHSFAGVDFKWKDIIFFLDFIKISFVLSENEYCMKCLVNCIVVGYNIPYFFL